MTIGCNLYGAICFRPDGIDEGGRYLGDDGSVIEIYERGGTVHRHQLKIVVTNRKRRFPHQVLQELKGRLSEKQSLALQLDTFKRALLEVLPSAKMPEFWKRVRYLRAEHMARRNGQLEKLWAAERVRGLGRIATHRLAKAADGGRNFAVKAARCGRTSKQGEPRLPRLESIRARGSR